MAAESEFPPRHDWNLLENHLNILDGVLRRDDWMIERNGLQFTQLPGALKIHGKLQFRNGSSLGVMKQLELQETDDGQVRARTVQYVYEGKHKGKDLFRYDNWHVHSGHEDEHHKHVFDDSGRDTTVWIGRENWPLLSEVWAELVDLTGGL